MNRSALEVRFKVNDRAVYPAHGVGQISAIEEQIIGSTSIEVYVINFAREKMTLRVPVKRAAACGLRPLATKKQLEKVTEILQGKAKNRRGMWSRKAQEFEAKINSGEIEQIAEVVRDLWKNVEDPDRSYSERVIYETALARIASEFAAVYEITTEEASQRINDVLKEREIV